MEQVNQRKAGVVLSYINLALGCIVPLLYTPVMLRMLGQAEYGLFSLSQSIVGYLSLLNFGMGSVIIRYAARYRAENKVEEIKRLTGLFVIIYSVLAVLVCVVGMVLVWQADTFFSEGLNSGEVARLRVLMCILITNTALSFPFSVISSLITVYERFVFAKVLGIIGTVAMPCSNLIILFFGGASIGMAISSMCVQIISNLLYAWYAVKKLHLRPTFKNMPTHLLKEILVFSSFLFMMSITDMLYWATDKVLIGARLGAVAVAIYNVGGVFTSMLQNLSQAISGVFTPKVMMMSVEDQSAEHVSELMKRVGRLQFYVVAFVLSGYIVFGQSFIRLWAGEGYDDAYFVALLTMIPLAIPLIQSIALSACIAQNKHRFRAIVFLIIAVINAVSTYIVLPYFGIIGASVCTGVAFVLGTGFAMNIYYAKRIKLDVIGFWVSIVRISIAPIALCLGAYSLVNAVLRQDSWIFLAVAAVAYSLVFWVVTWFCSMNRYEKTLFKGMFGKVTAIFKRKRV